MYLRRTHLFAFALLLTLSAAVRADQIDDYVKAQMERQHIPGTSLVVIKDQKVVKLEGYGFANVELNAPARPDTVYKIGSVSKQFIASGIMLLVQDGKISLDDNVSKFLEGTPDTWKPITIRHLLTHTSGIIREAPGFDPLKVQNDADVIKTAYSLPLRFAPGEKYEYCNAHEAPGKARLLGECGRDLGQDDTADEGSGGSGKKGSDEVARRPLAPRRPWPPPGQRRGCPPTPTPGRRRRSSRRA